MKTTQKNTNTKSGSNIQLENKFNVELKSIYEVNQSNKIDFIKALNSHINTYIKLFNYDILKKLVSKLTKNSNEMEIITNFIIFNKENKLQLNEARIATINNTNMKLMLNKLDTAKISEFKKELSKIKYDVLIIDKYNISLQNLINKYLVIKLENTVKKTKTLVKKEDKKENEDIREELKKENEKTIIIQFNRDGSPKNIKETLKNEMEFLISKGVTKETLKNIMLEILA